MKGQEKSSKPALVKPRPDVVEEDILLRHAAAALRRMRKAK